MRPSSVPHPSPTTRLPAPVPAATAGSVVPRSTRRRGALRVLWRTARASRQPGTPGLGRRLAATPAMTRDALRGRWRGPGRARLALAALGVLYVVSPVDVVPEAFLPLVGLLDDATVAAWTAGSLLIATEDYAAWRAAGSPAQR